MRMVIETLIAKYYNVLFCNSAFKWVYLSFSPDYTVEVTNRFKGLDLTDRVPEELWTKVRDIVQQAVFKTTPKKNVCKKQNGCLRMPHK